MIERHEPDLVLLHFLCVDSFQHLYGPRSPEAYWALEYIDERLRVLLEGLPSGLDRGAAIFVVSDHGFLPVTKDIRINVWLRKHGALSVNRSGIVDKADARFVTNHGAGYLYVLESEDPARLAGDLVSALRTVEGVSDVWRSADYPALGIPSVSENPHVGDLLLEAAAGYCFADDVLGDEVIAPSKYRGTHGQRPGHPDNRAFFLAAGPGIVRGRQLGAISSCDVAPTIAHALGIAMGPVEGHTLMQIFE